MQQTPKKIILGNSQSPGDVLVMTGAIECLHEQYPGQYLTGVSTTADQIFENNPHITPLKKSDPDVRFIPMHYPLINSCNQRPVHFLQGYCDYLGEQLGHPIVCTTNQPHLYISDQENAWLPQVHEKTKKPIRYWVINAGTKFDYTAKNWGVQNYQTLAEMLYGKIQFVQIGASEHYHRPLNGVIDLVGKTDIRQLIRLCWHAEGGVGPVTFLHHIMAAFHKPYVCLNGGREPVSWEQYPTATMLNTIGRLPCCQGGGCWRSRTVSLGDGDEKDKSLCELPVFGGEDTIPKCMAMIHPEEVARAIEQYYLGGVLKY